MQCVIVEEEKKADNQAIEEEKVPRLLITEDEVEDPRQVNQIIDSTINVNADQNDEAD